MVDVNKIGLKLLEKDDATTMQILKKANVDYINFLSDIADDIYDSCIALYYKYEPKVYRRHGKIEGINLYRAHETSFDGENWMTYTDSDLLLPYRTSEDIRQKVLTNVKAGIRGLEKRNGKPVDPRRIMSWKAYYPNEFSQYDYWRSNGATMNDIWKDFEDNIATDMLSHYWNFVSKYL